MAVGKVEQMVLYWVARREKCWVSKKDLGKDVPTVGQMADALGTTMADGMDDSSVVLLAIEKAVD